MSIRGRLSLSCLGVVLFGCASAPPPPPSDAAWSVADHELLHWTIADSAFAQDHAIEASGLTASARYLYAVSEKYATLLQIDPQADYRAVAVSLEVPPGSELESVAWSGGALLMSDEAHGAVYEVRIDDEEAIAAGSVASLAARRVATAGFEIEGGKLGVEGMAVDLQRSLVHMVVERVFQPDERCEARVYSFEATGDGLKLRGEPLVVALADCNWRIAGATIWNGRVLAIQSRYPGEVYLLVAIDPESGEVDTVLDITELGRSLRGRGFGNNLEGLVIGPSGDLYLVGDNADVRRAEGPKPPPAKLQTVFLRLPLR